MEEFPYIAEFLEASTTGAYSFSMCTPDPRMPDEMYDPDARAESPVTTGPPGA